MFSAKGDNYVFNEKKITMFPAEGDNYVSSTRI